jgi:hypothetical protein
MKIAVWHNLPSGGSKRALYDHVRGLVTRGHIVEAWCPQTADPNYLPLRGIVREHILPLDWPPKEQLSDFWQITLQGGNLWPRWKRIAEFALPRSIGPVSIYSLQILVGSWRFHRSDDTSLYLAYYI